LVRATSSSLDLAPLPEAFYARPVLDLTRALLGCLLVRRRGGALLIGRIVETEAYAGHLDPASHAYRGETQRNRSMFGPPAHGYVYFTYGNHFCLNVTARRNHTAAAVLLRAVEPTLGVPAMRRLRAAATSSPARAEQLLAGAADDELCRGPGRLTAAFAVDDRLDGHPLTRGRALWIARGTPPRAVAWTPRIGLGENPAAPWLWRCVDARSDAVSAIPRRWPRASRATPRVSELRAR
jgi:DNA-3-methyladenine glycosylase